MESGKAGYAVRFIGRDGVDVLSRAKAGETVLEALRRIDPTLLDAPCGGAGNCGKCKLRVVSGRTSACLLEERRRLQDGELAAGIRLACRLRPLGDLVVTASEQKTGAAVIREAFNAIVGKADPRITEAGLFGAAIDIGTTTIAAYLVEYTPPGGESARVVATASALNRQKAFGADVIARIDHCVKRADGLAVLSGLVREDARRLIDRLLSDVGADAAALREIAVVGNTTMLHLFAAVDPSSIAVAPFTPAFVEPRQGPAAEFGLFYPHAELMIAPSVAGYVGADLVAGALAVGLDRRERPCLLLDLGTNGEMALGDKHGVVACATAAGPAFEGAAISCGIGGVEGAIDSLSLTADGRLTWTVIGGGPPAGVCGSGIIDAAACVIRSGAADDSGALDERWKDGYPLAPSPAGLLRFTQADIRQIQLAKAAVAAGIATLLAEGGLGFDDIEAVYLAGGFGSYLKAESAAAIGLIPWPLLAKVATVGNAAGHGAVRLLLFRDEAARIARFARSVRYLELSGSSLFNERFIDELCFPAPATAPA